MLSRAIEVVAASRLHFGLLAFGGASKRQFGGVGAMVEQPQLRLRVAAAAEFRAAGPAVERMLQAARLWAGLRRLPELPRCEIAAVCVPRPHTGLGTGTQLALSVAAGLDAFCELPPLPAEQLGPALGRGRRSAVGLYGFLHGGLIAELGKLSHERISPLHQRLELPSGWRFVLICPRGNTGLSGRSEAEVFGRLPPVPAAVSYELLREMTDRLLPAAAAGDFADFAESVYRFGHRAGECYAAVQGGPFHGPRAQALVERLRGWGVAGVGQSSWGPTIYALCRDEQEASWLRERVQSDGLPNDCDFTVSAPRNRGASVTWTER